MSTFVPLTGHSGLAGRGRLRNGANFHDDALVRAKLDVAAYGLVQAVSGAGHAPKRTPPFGHETL